MEYSLSTGEVTKNGVDIVSAEEGDGCGCIYRIHYWGNNKYQTTDHWEIPLLGIVIGGSV